MAFILRRPFAVSSAIPQIARSIPKSTSTTAPFIRAFHPAPTSSKISSRSSRNASFPISSISKASSPFLAAFKRSYIQPAQVTGPSAGNLTQRILYGAGIFGGTLVAINLVFNRETREDGGMPLYEREYLNQTFLHTGMGIGVIGIAANALHRNGWTYRLMAANPWLVMGVGLACSIGTMYATFSTSPDK
jgi:hypothetical protein